MRCFKTRTRRNLKKKRENLLRSRLMEMKEIKNLKKLTLKIRQLKQNHTN